MLILSEWNQNAASCINTSIKIEILVIHVVVITKLSIMQPQPHLISMEFSESLATDFVLQSGCLMDTQK